MPKTKIVMNTALAGDGIDIQAGNVCVCSADQAESFLAVGYARPYDPETDEARTVKHYPEPQPPKVETKAAKSETKAAKPDAKSAKDEPKPAKSETAAKPKAPRKSRAKSPAA
ncbi:hypothetical protein [Aureliella helgolandensis]|uniref:Uncharacterized protein n=1 Tax=Aureliella helgolandensis TaxID=2527968 RepID=A0A518GDV6_9BACT|nr:hypothetical protein [Aureliella helgolandensis]QDV26738.1 hypothetical protein Q31a_51170 [Aureliella helgolandensis]